jgi:hypothetical protein
LFQPCPLPDEPEDAFKSLPTFCRIAATLKPTSDSDIKIEIWIPVSGLNGKFIAVGNGGWAGAISYADMGVALARGYAVASTNTGHDGTFDDASFASGHPEKLIDFGYRAVHEMTAKAKAIITAYYGNAPKRSYWNGCSTGGRQALMEAQRFPADFDGLIAGAPANYLTHLPAQSLWIAQAVHKDEAGYIPPAKYALIHNAVLVYEGRYGECWLQSNCRRHHAKHPSGGRCQERKDGCKKQRNSGDLRSGQNDSGRDCHRLQQRKSRHAVEMVGQTKQVTLVEQLSLMPTVGDDCSLE